MSAARYDGRFVVVHQVQHGENLSAIARKYRFPQWQPIWIFNTKVHTVLGPNPDAIRPGEKIFIPRTKQLRPSVIIL